jgi:hypothetical protein
VSGIQMKEIPALVLDVARAQGWLDPREAEALRAQLVASEAARQRAEGECRRLDAVNVDAILRAQSAERALGEAREGLNRIVSVLGSETYGPGVAVIRVREAVSVATNALARAVSSPADAGADRKIDARIAEVRRILSSGEPFAALCSREGRPFTFGYVSGGHVSIWHGIATRHVYERAASPPGSGVRLLSREEIAEVLAAKSPSAGSTLTEYEAEKLAGAPPGSGEPHRCDGDCRGLDHATIPGGGK